MKFYKLGEIPARDDDVVFRVSPTACFIPFGIFSGLVIWLLILGIGVHKHPGVKPPGLFFVFAFAAFLCLFTYTAFAQWRASLKPTNWMLRCNRTGVLIQFRTFLNWRFPETDVEAIGLDYSEIAWARVATEKRIVPSMNVNQRQERQRLTYVDFGLVDTDTSALESHLQTEQNLGPVGMMVFRDYPVEVLPGGILQVRWHKSGQYRIRPAAKKAVEYLSQHVKILPPESANSDLTARRGLSPQEADAKIAQLARSGDQLAAIQLAREVHGFTLNEAVTLVDKLKSGG